MCLKNKQTSQKEELRLILPDKSCLVARVENDPIYPGINIYLRNENGAEELICFAEFNSEKPPGQELCLGAYMSDEDDVMYYDNYRKG